jgi:hypothetical protein
MWLIVGYGGSLIGGVWWLIVGYGGSLIGGVWWLIGNVDVVVHWQRTSSPGFESGISPV